MQQVTNNISHKKSRLTFRCQVSGARSQSGQSILEVIIALTIFALIAAALASLAVGGLVALEQGGEQTQAEALAQEGIEAIRSIRDGAWNENVYTTSSVAISGGEWVFSGEGTTETIGQFTRTISFKDVCRDASDDIATCPAAYTDVHSQKATVTISWETRPGVTNIVQRISYVTNWDSRDRLENVTADFANGTFTTTTSTTLGDGDGAITLEEL